ncbi:MAG: T9SS type A sorting domain-containing protein [Flavobacteriales bacterium]
MLKRILCCAVMLTAVGIHAQEFFTVMNYNVLNFPTGSMQNRQDTLKKIIDFVEPDFILLQELKSEAGLISIAEESCVDLEGEYRAANWETLQSNPNSGWPLQQNIVYNAERFTLHEENVVLTSYRDFNEFIFYFNSEELETQQDTAFLYVYTTHLKSSQGGENEQLRLEMVEYFTAHLATLPADAQVIIGGDFNLYNSDEPAYQLLLSVDNAIQLEDPIDMPGDWHSSSYPDKSILTQSTRTSSIFGDGAGGGLDDRFDFMLCSENMLDGSVGYQYVNNSYYSLGNNGTCYNENITDCMPNFSVPSSVMNALYYMSDHLPVIMQLQLDQTSSISELNKKILLRSNMVSETIRFNQSLNETVEIYSVTGKKLLQRQLNGKSINVNGLSSGAYILVIGEETSLKFVKL